MELPPGRPPTGQHPHEAPGHLYGPSPYGPQHGPQHGRWTPPVPPAAGRSVATRFWIGAALSVPACVVLVIVAILLVQAVGGDTARTFVPMAAFLALGASAAGIAVPRSRWYVVGGLVGAAILTILATLAMVVVFAAFLSAWVRSGAH